MTEASYALDGNAAAGVLAELFAVDVTAAEVTCSGCGHVGPLATALAFLRGPGAVLRCRRCEQVVARVVTHSGAAWLDLSGSALWRIPTSA